MDPIRTNFKADALDPTLATPETPAVDTPAADTDELLHRLEAALSDLEQFSSEYSGYLTEEQLREMDRLAATMKAEIAAIEAYGVGGSAAAGAAAEEMTWEMPTELAPEWNVPEGRTLRITENDADAALLDDPTTYAGTVNFEAEKLAFSLQDDRITNVETKTVGKDLILTVTYQEGDTVSQKSWIIVDGSVRSEPIVIDATRMTHAVTIDCSGALRISDGRHGEPTGLVTGFQIWGTNLVDQDDVIYGSQGRDGIVGLNGNDIIDGGAGDDIIYGDEVYAMEGGYATDGGDDYVRGGAGADQIFGGGGIDTGYSSDRTTATNPDRSIDMGGTIRDDSSVVPDLEGWLTCPGWATEVEDGEVVLTRTGESGGTIDIDMPPGYTMAFADVDPDGDSLVITFVGEDSVGNSTTFNVKIKDFLKDLPAGFEAGMATTTLNFRGDDANNIIDFHKIKNLTSSVVNITGGGGSDFILGVESMLTRDGIDTANWQQSTASSTTLSYYADSDLVINTEEGTPQYEAELDGSQINVHLASDSPASTDSTNVTIVAPDGYTDHGYITVDPSDNRVCVILVNASGDSIVVKFDDENLDPSRIHVQNLRPETATADNPNPEAATPINLIPISFSEDMYSIDGGAGSDVIFASEGSHVEDPEEDFVVTGDMPEEE